MSDAGKPEYVPDKLYERLFAPWRLPREDWPLCKEDWMRVDAITRLPWKGRLLDFGAGDGTLAALVCSRNPEVTRVDMVEPDGHQTTKALLRWKEWPIHKAEHWRYEQYDGALCCEVMEHLTPEEGHVTLKAIHDALLPGAMLCATVPSGAGSRAAYPGHIRRFTPVVLKSELEAVGFNVTRISPICQAGPGIWGVWTLAVAFHA